MKSGIYNTIHETIEDIVNYCTVLNEQGYTVSLCRLDPIFNVCMEKFLPYGGHNFEYCMRVKSCRKSDCDQRQRDLKRRITKDNFGPFTCFAGVTEFVFPIEQDGQRYGIVCLSGYRTDEKMNNRAYMQLSDKIPDKQIAKGIITPLLYMLESLIKNLKEAETFSEMNAADIMYQNVLRFISNNIDKAFSLTEICEQVGYSQTYVSREFKKRKGKSVFDYVIDLRIATATKLLTNTDLRVIDIAYQVGFSDVNYFTSLFKKRTGYSPSEVRKRQRFSRV